MGTVAYYFPRYNVIELTTQDASGQDRTDTELTVLDGDSVTETLLSAGWEAMGEWVSEGDSAFGECVSADVMEV